MKALKDYTGQIKQLCDTHHVESLYAFGSEVSDSLPRVSDIVLIADIDSKDPLDYSDNYLL